MKVAIVGGGFSGTMTAVHLARGGAQAVLIEKGDRFARGLAYGTQCDAHLLNVQAGKMSALDDEPEHFLGWLQARDPSANAKTFAARSMYGDYLEELLNSVRGIERVRDEVTAIEHGDENRDIRLTTKSHGHIISDRVVLALGHPAPQCSEANAARSDQDCYVANPWAPGVLEGLSSDDAIGLIGTGLTAVDMIVEARGRGHRGQILAISRHGLSPSRHRPALPRPHFHLAGKQATARTLMRTVRDEAERCRREGGDWRSVIDAIRPEAQKVWRSMGEGERSRFIRHVAPQWDVHRHRVAPQIADVLDEARRDGCLEIIAGRILNHEPRGDGEALTFRRRGASHDETRVVRRLINCTGPARDIRTKPSPLLASLLSQGLAKPGPLALGFEAGEHGALVGCAGQASECLFALGPLLKEQLWETTAVRELRVQARELASHLLSARVNPL